MPIQPTWDNDEKTVIRQVFSAPWTVDDYRYNASTTYDMIDSVTHQVDVIMDGSKSHMAPSGVLSSLGYVESKVHPRQRFLVGVTHSMLLKGLVRVGKILRPSLVEPLNIVDTLEDAYKKLEELEQRDVNISTD